MSEQKTIHPIFDECKAKELSRYAIDRTWVFGGHVYATDGRIVVRSKTDEPDTPKEGHGWPPAYGLFTDTKRSDKPLVMPSKCKPIVNSCRECNGCGEWYCNCPDCANEHPCDSCEDGKVIEWPVYIFADIIALGGRYVDILVRHTCTAYPSAKKAKASPVYFTFDGGEGLLMPVSCGSAIEWKEKIEVPQ